MLIYKLLSRKNKITTLVICLCFALGVFAGGCKKSGSPSLGNGTVSPGDFLSSHNYDQMNVEVQYISGYQPSAATISNLSSFLQARLNKPNGIHITQKALSISHQSSYSLSDIRNIESANRTQNVSGHTVAAYIFFADGDYASNSGSSFVLGMQYGNSSIVMFEKTIQNLSGGVGQPSVATLETTVSEHEFGHMFGLVNNGSPMVSSHQDASNGKHCNNKNCLMYYSVETSDVVNNLIGGVPSLDANCMADLHANGGQ
jgi:predicted Zn-dependent protease